MKRVLVTGSNKGIGLAIVEALLSQRADVYAIICSRDIHKGDEAKKTLIHTNPSWESRVESIQLDVTNEASVKAAVATVAKGGLLYGLVNNAGILSDVAEDLLTTNLYGPKRVVDHFLPLIDPAVGRIVNIGSGAAPNFVKACSPERAKIITDSAVTWDAIVAFANEFVAALHTGGEEAINAAGFGKGDSPMFHVYGMTKAALAAYTIALARENPHLKVNVCTPGLIATDLFIPLATQKGVNHTELAASYGALPPSESTVSTVRLLFGEVGSGHYYGSDGKRSPMFRYRAPGTPEYDGSEGN